MMCCVRRGRRGGSSALSVPPVRTETRNSNSLTFRSLVSWWPRSPLFPRPPDPSEPQLPRNRWSGPRLLTLLTLLPLLPLLALYRALGRSWSPAAAGT